MFKFGAAFLLGPQEYDRWLLVESQICSVEAEQRRQLRDDATPGVETIRQLIGLKGVGLQGAWLLEREFFGWRSIRNRRQVASLAGLTPTPYGSGQLEHEQGISKAGNKRLRWLMVELAWCWRRYQPTSRLSVWYQRRFAEGSADAEGGDRGVSTEALGGVVEIRVTRGSA